MIFAYPRPRSPRGTRSSLVILGLGLCAMAGGTATADAKSVKDASTGVASFYGREENGSKTANGERFNMYAMTAAHRTAPMGSRLRVTNLKNGKTVVVRVNDRGPYARGRIIDLSYRAASELDFIGSGVTKVKVELVASND